MMSDPLATYLHDHLAGAVHAVELLEAMQKRHADDSLGAFAAGLLSEIEADRSVLRDLAERTGIGTSGVKELGAWITEKVSRTKLSDQEAVSFGTFEALEFLVLGIHGKWTLWTALAAVAPTESRLQGMDFARLIARAKTQEAQVDQRRLEIARVVFRPPTK
jgi:hypothetical protein